MRNAFAKWIVEAAQKDDRIVVLVADISPAGAMNEFRDQFPRRFINVGVAEQSMIGIAAGMALLGFKPFCYTIASFALFRTYEFIRLDLAYQRLPVTVVGMGAGLSYSTLGSTHHSAEDLKTACSIPQLNVFAPCDSLELCETLDWCLAIDDRGPSYVRIGKAGEPILTHDAEPWSWLRPRRLRDGSRKLVITYGTIADKVLDAVDQLRREDGTRPPIGVVSVSTLKPLPSGEICDLLRGFHEGMRSVNDPPRYVLVVEESPSLLGTAIRALAYSLHGHNYKVPDLIYDLSLADSFLHNFGSRDELLNSQGLSVSRIKEALQ